LALSIIHGATIFGMQNETNRKAIELFALKKAGQPTKPSSEPIRYAETFVETIELSESARAHLIQPQSFLPNSPIDHLFDEDGPIFASENTFLDTKEKEPYFSGFELVFHFDDLNNDEPGSPSFLIDKSDTGLEQSDRNQE